MFSYTAIALLGLVLWTLLLLVWMETLRSKLVISGAIASNQFQPDNGNLSPFMQRLARAHANCVENLPIFASLMLLAISTESHFITDSLAMWLLLSRFGQSCIHLVSLSVWAVNLRFSLFVVQVAIALYWTINLLIHFHQ
ncbi:MAPEG family protein [Bowmanella sp. JS7-9]|uniref:MAPEG family protein n=1 Tax=Pseudobowmanella zhangzhouensis TaxID=1537679 RepID=A0ABW1XPY6_9ALTE|nr:MAPEG family protein [Bowmanella sp. JS7-9]TBX23715.1 MAPEG family protein [Bowmanella sp. JS7-9]